MFFFGCIYSKLVLINSKNGKKFSRFFKKSKGLEGQFCKKIDLKSRYHQIQVGPLDGIHERHYVLIIELHNRPSTFQVVMDI